jgi:hypothetical protein
MKLTPADYGPREVIKEFDPIPAKGGVNVAVPVGSRVEALHNADDDPLLLFRWDGANYKTAPNTYRANTKSAVSAKQ